MLVCFNVCRYDACVIVAGDAALFDGGSNDVEDDAEHGEQGVG